MATDLIFTVKVNGVEESASKLNEVGTSIEKVGQKAAATSAKTQTAGANFSTLGSTMAESFSNAALAVSAFGLAGDDVTKAISLAAIAVRAVTGVTKAWTVAQGSLNAVLKANPIGAVIAAITALILAGKKLIEMLDLFGVTTKKNAKEAADAFDDAGGALDRLTYKYDQLIEKAKLYGASDKELFDLQQRRTRDLIALQKRHINNLVAAGATEKEIQAARFELEKMWSDYYFQQEVFRVNTKKKADEDSAKSEKEKADAIIKANEDIAAARKDYDQSVEESNNKLRDLREEAYANEIKDETKLAIFKEEQRWRDVNVNIRALEQKARDNAKAAGIEFADEYKYNDMLETAELIHKQNIEKIKADSLAKQAEARKKAADAEVAEIERVGRVKDDLYFWSWENRINTMNDGLAKELEIIDLDHQSKLRQLGDMYTAEEEYNAAVVLLTEETEAKKNKAKKNAALEAITIRNTQLSQEFGLLQQFGQLMIDAEDLFGKKGTERKKGFAVASVAIEKAGAIGQVWANTAIANAKAVAELPLTLGQPWVTINTVTAGISTASVALAAVKAIKEIYAAGNSGSLDSESSSPPPPPPPSKFALGGLVTGNGTSYSDSIPAMLSNGESVMNANTTQMFGGLLSAMNQAGGGAPIGDATNQSTPIIKAYVVSSEMTTQQEADKKVRDLARI